MVLRRDVEVFSAALHLDAQTAEHVGDDPQFVVGAVLDGDLALRHGGHADEASDFNHVRQATVLGASQRRHTFDDQEVGTDAADLPAHAVDHLAQLLQVRLAGRVVNRGRALGQRRRHDNVCGARHRCLVEQHVGARQSVWGTGIEEPRCCIVAELCAELLESNEVGVHAAAANFVASRSRDGTHAKAAQHRSENHHGPAQRAAFGAERVRFEVVEVDVVRLEAPGAGAQVLCLHAEVAQQVDELVDVDDVWQIVDGDRLGREHHRAEYLQRLVLGTLRDDLPLQAVPALNDETSHAPEFRRTLHAFVRFLEGLSTPNWGLRAPCRGRVRSGWVGSATLFLLLMRTCQGVARLAHAAQNVRLAFQLGTLREDEVAAGFGLELRCND